MTPTIHQGQVLKKFINDHRLKVPEVAKIIGVDRTYFYTLLDKEKITEKRLTALRDKLGFDPDTYAPNLTTKEPVINLTRIKVPGSKLREAMKSAGINQDEGAARLGVSRSTIIRYWQKPELERHIVDQVRDKLGIDLEAGTTSALPVQELPAESHEDEDALLRFSTRLYKEFQIIRNLGAVVNVHEKEIGLLKITTREQGKSIDGVNSEVRDIIRRQDALEKQQNELQRWVNNFKK